MKSPEQIAKRIVDFHLSKDKRHDTLVRFIVEAIQAERDAVRGLVDALNAARDSICEQATDTMWVDRKYSPNCTTVDYIDLSLAAYKAAIGEPSRGGR